MRSLGSEAAVGRIARLVGDLLQHTGLGIKVDALLAAEPHAMLIGDAAEKGGGDRTFVDGSLGCVVEGEQKLGGWVRMVDGVVDRAGQRTPARVDPDDE